MTTTAEYVLLTAAKNEERYIASAVESVVGQTVHPVAWFIVDDGSTDHTARILERCAVDHPFIRCISGGSQGGRSFGSKDRAVNEAYALAQLLKFDFIGIQDADIAPESNTYYEQILTRFEARPRLGIAGGYIYERSARGWAAREGNSPDSVAGGIQMFRRQCYVEIGGYTPLHLGGEDWLAQIKARMSGWEVEAYPDLPVYHHRATSTAQGRWQGLFRLGMMDASFGSDPIFELLKCSRRIPHPPLVFGGLARFGGYLWWKLNRRAPVVCPDAVTYLRAEQRSKVHHWFATLF